MKIVEVNLTNTDWKLLRKQKRALEEIEFDYGSFPRWADAAEGLLSWIDDIQGQAALQLGTKKVFGK